MKRKLSLLNIILHNKYTSLLKFHYHLSYYRFWHNKLIRQIRKEGKVKVVFFISSLAMWRGLSLYQVLEQDNRFKCIFVILPFKIYSEDEKRTNEIELTHYFNSLGLPYYNGFRNLQNTIDAIYELNPDILFYPQPYPDMYGNRLDSSFFFKSLISYIPYGFTTIKDSHLLNSQYQNFAWKIFLQTKYHVDEAKRLMKNKGKNATLGGELSTDDFTNNNFKGKRDPWKIKDKNIKRIIWAPHFTIVSNGLLHRDSFLILYEEILRFAEENKDRVQIAFKPHPRLKTELYKHPEWGEKRTNEYYEKWEKTDNLQLETGDYIQLFRSSDILIHDSGSFIADYLLTGNPAIFTSNKLAQEYENLNDFGKKCLDLHYKAGDALSSLNLLEDILFKNSDPLSNKRGLFHKELTELHGGLSSAEIIHSEIVKSLGI